MVRILDMNGRPLAPTNRYGRVRHLLNDGKAVIVKFSPEFTIRLKYNVQGKRNSPVKKSVIS